MMSSIPKRYLAILKFHYFFILLFSIRSNPKYIKTQKIYRCNSEKGVLKLSTFYCICSGFPYF